MKIFLPVLFSLAIFCAQAQWAEIDSPLGLVSTIDFVKTGPQNEGFAVGRSGLFLKSDTSLVHWKKHPFPFSGNLMVVNFLNSSIGLVGGEDGFLARTSDGGATWTTILSGMTEQFKFIEWLGGDAVIVCTTGGKLYKSTNLGLTFSLVQSFSGKTVSSLVFYNSENGYIGGAPNFFMKTVDGGQTWQNIDLSLSSPVYVNDISTDDGVNVIVTGAYSGSYSPFNKLSKNSGQSWQNFQTTPLGGFSSERVFRFRKDGSIVYYNGFGRLSISPDLGMSWTSKRYFYTNTGSVGNDNPSGYKVVGNRIFVTPSCFYSVDLETAAVQGIRMTTGTFSEGGMFSENTENLLLSQDNLFSALWRVEDDNPIFVNPPGQNGYIRGGVFLDSSTMLLLSTSRVPNNNFNGSTLFRYHRNSGVYDSLPIQYAVYFDGIKRIYMPDSQDIYCVRSNRKIIKSHDRGVNWLADVGTMPYDMYRIVSKNMWLSWQNNTLLKSSDEGITWTDITFGSFSNISECYFSDSLEGILIVGSKILKTSDGGANWSIALAAIPSQMSVGSFTTLFISAQRGFIFSGNSRYLETYDYGGSWTVKYYPFSDYLSFAGVDSKTKSAYVACRNQSMYFLSETVVLENKAMVKEITPLLVYPNPVQYQINLGAEVEKAMVFSSVGKVMDCPFRYQRELDCSSLPAGVYFLRYSIGGQWGQTRFLKASK